IVPLVAHAVDPRLVFTPVLPDNSIVAPRAILGRIHGPYRSILIAERTALNFLQRLSGVATLTRQYVDAIRGTRAVVLDTRKTTPGWRLLEKYAVRMGGGTNHRIGLYDAILIKDNHIAGVGGIVAAVERARAYPGNAGLPVEVEVDSLDQLRAVLPLRPEIVLLDNMAPEVMEEAVRLRDQLSLKTQLEASGGIHLTTIRRVAETGVDRISVGAITHSAVALDIALDETV
ncbi:MAG: carboxylating nicotinate-nucleotide diphosphorylase, partial [Gemmataceae bacterium]